MTLELRLSLLGLAFSVACSTPDSLDSSDDTSTSFLKTKKCHDHDNGHGNGHGYGHGKGHEDCEDEEKPIAPWKFVSIPDFLNSDIGDVSNLTSLVNSTNPAHEAAIARVLDEIAAENPDFVMVAGDLVNGHWYLDASGVQVFGPVSTRAQKQAAIAKAADVYYTTWKERFESRGLTVYPAVGDHDIGDNDWAANSEKAFLVPDYKAQFAKHFTLDANGQPIYARRPVGTPFENTSYAIRHKNLELVTLDEFRQDSPTTKLDAQRGSVLLSVDGDHLAWLDQELTDATATGKIKHVMVQGHIPVLTPVRTQNSSGMTMPGGAQTPFWQTLVNHHVDLYVAGEVHDMSANNNGGVEQAVHGAIMGYADDGSYMVGTVYPDRIELELKRFKMDYPSTEKLWQAGTNRPKAQYSVPPEPFESVGTLVIDKSSGQTQFLNRTGYFIPMNEQGGGDQQPAPPAQGLAVHMKFDETPGSTTAINSGTAGAIHNGAISGATYVAGRLGNAMHFDALDQIIAGPSPVAGSAARTTSAWVKVASTSTAIQTAFTFGKNTDGGKWDFDIDLAGNLELGVGNGRIDSAGSQNIEDGAWHNVTAVLPAGGTLAAAKLYVDGAPISFTAPTKAINTVATGTFVIGHGANALNSQPFAGDLDDLAIWARPLGPAEVQAMVSLAATAGLAYDAGKADKVLTAFASAANVQIDGLTWKYWPSGLTGPEGVVRATATSRYEINLGGGAGIVVPVDPNAEPPPAPSASGLAVHLAFDEATGSLTALNTGTAGAAQN
ncbi:MAG: hypothetical protein HOV81_41655, partial [Kofleriaceae bacterium]|nr:hypothetical protein [Kofleriaceae bacterium]